VSNDTMTYTFCITGTALAHIPALPRPPVQSNIVAQVSPRKGDMLDFSSCHVLATNYKFV
jgi:hypothetical protein